MLDPDDWPAFRKLSHEALDDALDYLQTVRERPVWQSMPEAAIERLRDPLPQTPMPLQDVYDEFTRSIMPYGGGNIHPRFFGWVQGSGTPTGLLADFLASAMNANVGGRNHGAVHVERAVIRWFLELFKFPHNGSGVLTTGTSAASVIALLIAKTRLLGIDSRESGIDNSAGRLVGYASTATHGCIRRAFEICGLGGAALHAISTDAHDRLDLATLQRAIAHDRDRGNRPFIIVANAGTVDVGAIDPLDEIARIARTEGLWYHVDGAFGAAAMLSSKLAPRLRGIELADSIAFDFHKWFHVPYDAGALIVRDADIHRATFAYSPTYLRRASRGLAGGEPWFTDLSPELSRGFRALKVWFTVKSFGARKIAEAIENNVRQAALLAEIVDAEDRFELLAPATLNIVCFRYCPPGRDAAESDEFNDELVIRLQESGEAVASSATIQERRAIRICITNQRTSDEDCKRTFSAIKRIAESML
ncbi:MAG: aminotransferase class V-fold PLP-dependent enzyme [Candidatus Eremiobacteraeota bacterium]|nr:aminotransferase class V-fold PLP-dependent enzyme [Candidatus Eremiobacteraeota bacterium]